MTELKLQRADITCSAADIVIVNLFEGVKVPGGATGALDSMLGQPISKAAQAGILTGECFEFKLLHCNTNLSTGDPYLTYVMGLGLKDELTPRRLYDLFIQALLAINAIIAWPVKVDTILHGAGIGGMTVLDSVAAIRLAVKSFNDCAATPNIITSVTVVEFNQAVHDAAAAYLKQLGQ